MTYYLAESSLHLIFINLYKNTQLTISFSVLGSCAGIVEHMAFYPIDTIKVSIMTSSYIKNFILIDSHSSKSFELDFHRYREDVV